MSRDDWLEVAVALLSGVAVVVVAALALLAIALSSTS